MRTLLLIIPSLFCAYATSAQQTFMNYYDGWGGWGSNSALIELTSHDIVTDLGVPISGQATCTSLLNSAGGLLHTRAYVGDTMGSVVAMARDHDNRFYFTSYYFKDTCGYTDDGQPIAQYHPVVGTMDSLGYLNELYYYVVNGGCQSLPIGLNVLNDHGAVIWGVDIPWDADGVASFAFRVGPSGTLLWARHFDRHGRIAFVKELPSGDLLMGMNLDTAGAVVARLSGNGDVLWCKSYVRPSGVVQDGVILSDNTFLVTGCTDGFASGQGALFAMKLDDAGAVIWCKSYSVPPLSLPTPGRRIVTSDEGNYVLLADILEPIFSDNPHPLLIKIDQNGDTLWTRSYGAGSLWYSTNCLLACSDGGLLFSTIVDGYLQSKEDEAVCLIKTDHEGHLLCHERCPGVNVMSLFPLDSSFVLAYGTGGAYFPAFAADSTAPAFAQYDGCPFNGFPEILHGRFSIYPNPSTGRFTLSFSDLPAAGSSCEVYDTIGRLLVQHALLKGQRTEELDLSRFGKGTYVIKFTEKGETCFERVVVE